MKGARGLAEDVRYYGQWMRDEAEKRIGHLYPKVEVTAELAKGRLRAKLPALRRALDGRIKPHHRVLLGQLLAHIEFLDESITQLTEEIEHCLTVLRLPQKGMRDNVGEDSGVLDLPKLLLELLPILRSANRAVDT